MSYLKNSVPAGFDEASILPKDSNKALNWQQENRTWWENHPMRYDWKNELVYEEFTKAFYEEIDKRFFCNAERYMKWDKIPFSNLINFDDLKDKKVLEIGVGNGSHAQLLAQHSKSYTGIDLTNYAVKSTSERMQCFNLKADIIQMDAENMKFDDNTFDFIWTWGVIHHSSNTNNILKEMNRVLKPGGRAVTMVYHHSFWNYYIISGLVYGVFLGKILKTKSIHKIRQLINDGAIARFYTIPEWDKIVSELFVVEKTLVCGQKEAVILLPGGKFKDFVISVIPDSFTRFVSNSLKQGEFLVTKLHKPG